MPGNASFTGASPNLTAFLTGFGQQIGRSWLNQVHEVVPLFAFLKEKGLISKTPIVNSDGYWKVSYNLVYDELEEMTEDSIGVGHTFRPAVPGAYIIPSDFTKAVYTVAKLGFAMVISEDDQILFSNGGSQGKKLADEKEDLFLGRFNKIIQKAIYSDNSPTSTRIAGLRHYMSASNTVGGISQSEAGNEWWQGFVSATGVAISRDFIYSIQNRHRRIAGLDGKPLKLDVLAVANRSDSELWGALQSEFSDLVVIDTKLRDTYGLDSIVVEGTHIFPDHNLPAGNVWGFNMGCLEFVGDAEKPKKSAPVRLPQSDALDVYYSVYAQLVCKMPKGLSRYTAVTAA